LVFKDPDGRRLEMFLDMLAEAHKQELRVRETEINQRMNWYDARTVDQLERTLAKARARLRVADQAPASDQFRTSAPVAR
jgi:hypothetical protein